MSSVSFGCGRRSPATQDPQPMIYPTIILQTFGLTLRVWRMIGEDRMAGAPGWTWHAIPRARSARESHQPPDSSHSIFWWSIARRFQKIRMKNPESLLWRGNLLSVFWSSQAQCQSRVSLRTRRQKISLGTAFMTCRLHLPGLSIVLGFNLQHRMGRWSQEGSVRHVG